MTAIDRLHAWAVGQAFLRVFTVLVRILLALAFVPSGLVKIMDEPFTTLPLSDPVGRFFAGFFSAHGYYRFVGVAQWVASALLLVPRTATLGATLYLPIVTNIFVITLAIGPAFRNTRVITGAMLLADLYLLFWDWDRWKEVLPVFRVADLRHGELTTALGLVVAAGLGLEGATRVHLAWLRHQSDGASLLMLIAGAILGLLMVRVAYRRAKTSTSGS